MQKTFDQVLMILLISGSIFSSCKLQSEIPDVIKTEIPTPQIASSQIQIPIEINLQPIITYANAKTDWVIRNPEFPNFASFGGCDGPQANYDVNRDFLVGNMKGNQFHISTVASYGIAGNYCSECIWGNCVHPRIPFSCGTNGESKRRVKVGFTSSLSLTPDYGLSTQTVVSELAPIDPCQLTFLKIDMTQEVMNAIRPSLVDGAKYMDDQAKQTQFKSQAQEAWNQLWTPLKIDGYGYLSMNPTSLSVSELSGDNLTLRFNLGIEANPIFKSTNEAVAIPPLPQLKTQNGNKNEFVFNLPIESDYNSLTNTLTSNFKGKKFESDDKKQSLLVHEIRIEGQGNSTLVLTMLCDLKMGFKKFKNATLYFTMTPAFNEASQIVELQNVKLQSDRGHLLLKTGMDLFQKTICSKIQEAGKIELKPILESNKLSLSQQLNKNFADGISMQGTIDNLKITGIYPTSNQLIIHAQATGKLAVRLDNYSLD
ncbi:MAG: DUF4403 family protein [Bacteroidetes bacterium]|nr:DUF4403 family protein [Bacteroidota bacterium]